MPFFRNLRILLCLLTLPLIFHGCQGGDTSGGGGSSPGTPTDQIVVINPNLTGDRLPSPVSLPMPLFQSSSVIYYDQASGRSFLFVIGGAYFDLSFQPDPINVNTVYWTAINPDGTILPFCSVQTTGSCQPLTPLLNNTRGHASVLNGKDIYVIGGIQSGGGQFNGGFTDAIYKSTITINQVPNSTNFYPTLSPWSQVGKLPVAESGMASVTIGSNLFVIGGIESGLPDFSTCSQTSFCQGSQTTVYSDKIYGYSLPINGPVSATTSTFHSTTTMPTGLFTPAAASDDASNLWVLGGWGPDPALLGTFNNLSEIYQYPSSGNTLISPTQTSPAVVGTLPMGLSKGAAYYLPGPIIGSGQMILIGGVSGNQGTPDVIHQEIYTRSINSLIYNAGGGDWTRIGTLPLPAVTCFASSMDPASGMIYVIGGIDARDPSCISN